MVFKCLSGQKHKFVYKNNTYSYRRMFLLFFGFILQTKDKSSFLLFSFVLIFLLIKITSNFKLTKK